MSRVSFTIHCEAASKANSRRHVLIRGRPASIKSVKALSFVAQVRAQLPPAARVMFDGEVAMEIRAFYSTERPDLDESALLDALQAVYHRPKSLPGRPRSEPILVSRGVYVNDRQVRERHVGHFIDRGDPRVEVVVYPRFQSRWEFSAP